jgi:hypothetical protein
MARGARSNWPCPKKQRRQELPAAASALPRGQSDLRREAKPLADPELDRNANHGMAALLAATRRDPRVANNMPSATCLPPLRAIGPSLMRTSRIG